MGKLNKALNTYSAIIYLKGEFQWIKNNSEKSNKHSKNANVNSSSTGATLQSSGENNSFTVGSLKVQSNEQAMATRDDNMSNMDSNINCGTIEKAKKFNERADAIKDIIYFN